MLDRHCPVKALNNSNTSPIRGLVLRANIHQVGPVRLLVPQTIHKISIGKVQHIRLSLLWTEKERFTEISGIVQASKQRIFVYGRTHGGFWFPQNSSEMYHMVQQARNTGEILFIEISFLHARAF
jgi:hypothetical protein